MKALWLLALLGSALGAPAISFTVTQTNTNEWSYDLTFDPYDNYSICQPNTTITLAGLGHVVAAEPPNSTDLPGSFFEQLNTNWIPEVLAGGLGVRWTHIGSGTGNFPEARHVYGFRVFADTVSTGAVYLVTSGVALDGPCPSQVRDISSSISGPVETNRLQVGVSVDLFSDPAGRSLTIIGPPTHTCRLQAADGMPAANWTELASFTLSSPVTNVVDLTATNSSTRFYRVISP